MAFQTKYSGSRALGSGANLLSRDICQDLPRDCLRNVRERIRMNHSSLWERLSGPAAVWKMLARLACARVETRGRAEVRETAGG